MWTSLSNGLGNTVSDLFSNVSIVVVVGDPRWQPGLLGLVASALVEKYERAAFVWGRGDGETIKGSARSDGNVRIVMLMEAAKDAFTEYEVVERYKYSTLVHIRPKTGRTHQIRVHFAFHGHPVLHDEIYGRKCAGKRLALHAAKIIFQQPMTNKCITVKAELPDDFKNYQAEERMK